MHEQLTLFDLDEAPTPRDRATLENTDQVLRCHAPKVCAEQVCSLHNRTNHHMRTWPQHWRGDRYLMERTCAHGVGHPDPDDYMIITGRDSGVHGCDGCCLTSNQPSLV